MTTWIILRAAGIGAYLMLFLSVAWGLIATTGALSKRVSKASATSTHQFMSTAGLLLLGVHIGGLLVDAFMTFGPKEVLIPMQSTFKPIPVTFGVLAMYAAVIVLATSWTRKYIGTRWWRRMHILAAPAFTLALVHGVFSGTDTARPWMWWTYIVTGLLVVFLLVVRALTVGFRPERAAPPAHAVRSATTAVAGRNGHGDADPVRGPVLTPLEARREPVPAMAEFSLPAASGAPSRNGHVVSNGNGSSNGLRDDLRELVREQIRRSMREQMRQEIQEQIRREILEQVREELQRRRTRSHADQGGGPKGRRPRREEAEGRRVAPVRKSAGECSGFTYELRFEDVPSPQDEVVEANGLPSSSA